MPNTYSFLGVTVSGSFQYLVQVRGNTYYDGLGNELFSVIGSVTVGPQGRIGNTGIQGETGPQGPAGGGTGTQGETGPQGFQGFQGIQGPTGAILSTRNDPFNSVLSINIFHGFGSYPPVDIVDDLGYVIIPQTIVHNTVNDYTVIFATISSGTVITGGGGFDGPKGNTGTQGWQGYTGPQGEVGPQGATGTSFTYVGTWNSGNNYYPNQYVEYLGLLYVNYSFQSTGALPPDQVPGAWLQLTFAGSTGAQGETGPQGVQGHTGPQGNQGIQGPQGSGGGETGAQGETGPQGFQGFHGPTGADGAGAVGNNDVGVIYLKNNTIPTIISTINERVVVAGTMSTGTLFNFVKDTSTNSLKYTGTGGRFHVISTFNFNGGSRDVFGFYIGKNTNQSSPLDPNADRISESEIYINSNQPQDQPAAGAIQTVLDLNTNDRIFLIVQNKESTSDITVEFMKFIATSLTAEKGSQGATGPQGETGPQGNTGLQGFQGLTGPQGVQGVQGLQGETGPQGVQGFTGPQGFQGFAGPQGFQGESGPQGYQGLQGTPGQSSHYFGYNATHSLSGDPGPSYLLWNNSTQIGATQINISHLDVTNTDVDVFLSQIKVTDTLILQDQVNSNNYQKFSVNNSITIFPNSYVEVPVTYATSSGTGTTNFSSGQHLALFIFSAGIDGPQGFQGETGPQGFQGEIGPQGETGIQGPQGFQGEIGPQGETGIQGPQGFQGETGLQGFEGPQGPQGWQGETGPQGERGFQGPQGFQGIKGNDGQSNFITDFFNQSLVVVTHSFNGYPLVQAVDSSDINIQPASYSIKYITTDSYVINFGQTYSGKIITGGGLTGPQGFTGPQGNLGPQGIVVSFVQTTVQWEWYGTGSVPNIDGKFTSDTLSFTSSQFYYFSKNDVNSVSYAGWFDQLDTFIQNGNKSYLQIYDVLTASNTGLYEVIDVQQGTFTYSIQTSPAIVSSGNFATNSVYNITWVAQGLDGKTGSQGVQGPQGSQGIQGIQGIQGFQGPEGFQGVQGFQGWDGPQGQPGTSTSYFKYKSNTLIITGYPTDGKILWTDASQISATAIHVSHLTDDNVDVDVILSSFYVGQVLIIQDDNVSGNFQKWIISATPSNVNPNSPSSYWIYPVTSLTFSGTYTFSNDQQIVLAVLSQGSNGAQGFQGFTGPQGWQGSQGPGNFTISATAPSGPTSGDRWYDLTTGFEYVYIFDGDSSQWVTPFPTGTQGLQGPAGSGGGGGGSSTTGLQGPTGPQGNQGVQGFQGFTGPQGNQGAQGFQGFTGPQGVAGSISALPINQIAFGTGTGITSSSLLSFTSSTRRLLVGSNSILGTTVDSSIISGVSNNIYSSNCSVIIGGWRSEICNSNFSGIVGGLGNDIFNSSCLSTIVGGYYNFIGTASCNSSIIGGLRNTLQCNSRYSSIVGGQCNRLTNSSGSSIITGTCNIECNSHCSSIISGFCNLMANSFSTSIIGGNCNCLNDTYFSSIVGGLRNCLTSGYCLDSIFGGECNYIGQKTQNNFILGGNSNNIYLAASQSIIIGGQSNCMFKSNCKDSIIGGERNKIELYTCSSSILGGENNIIRNLDFGSSIIGGNCNTISGCTSTFCSDYNSILGGKCNEIRSGNPIGYEQGGGYRNATNNAIIGGYRNKIGVSPTNVNYNYGVCNSAIVGGTNLILSKNECNLVYVPELKIATASNDNNLTKVLVWDDASTKRVKFRDASTLGSGGSSYIYDNTLFVHPDGDDLTAVVGNFNLPFATIGGAYAYVISNGIVNPVIEIWPKNSTKGPSPLNIPSATHDYSIGTYLNITVDIKFHLKSGVRIKFQDSSGVDRALFKVTGCEIVVTSDDSTATIEVFSSPQDNAFNYLVDVSNGGSYGKAIFENVTLYTISLQEVDPFINPRSSFGACVRRGAQLIMKNVLFYNHYVTGLGGSPTKTGNVFMIDESTFEAWNCKFYNRIERDQDGAHICIGSQDWQGGYTVIRLHDSSFIQRFQPGVLDGAETYVILDTGNLSPFVIMGNNTFFINNTDQKFDFRVVNIGSSVLNSLSSNGNVQYVSRSIHNYTNPYNGSWTEIIGPAESNTNLGLPFYGFLEKPESTLFEPFDTINLI